MADLPILPIEEIETCYYLRINTQDKPGVLADITRLFADNGISIEAMLQRPIDKEDRADIIIITHLAVEKRINTATKGIEALSSITGAVVRLRLEHLNG
jgi:homoserine dehydrogenase